MGKAGKSKIRRGNGEKDEEGRGGRRGEGGREDEQQVELSWAGRRVLVLGSVTVEARTRSFATISHHPAPSLTIAWPLALMLPVPSPSRSFFSL